MGQARGKVIVGYHPAIAIAGDKVSVNHTIEILKAEIWGLPADFFSILVDNGTGRALKANQVLIQGTGSRTEDLNIGMPNKNLNAHIELWSEIPDKWKGIAVEWLR